jgi:DNA primase
MEGIDFRAALEQLADRAGVVLPKHAAKAPEVKAKEEAFKDRLYEVSEAATTFFEAELAKRQDIRDYLAKRTVSAVSATTWRLGYAPASWDELCRHLLAKGFTNEEIVGAGLAVISDRAHVRHPKSSYSSGTSDVEHQPPRIYDRFRGRIMFPIFDNANKVIAFSGRFFEKVPGSREEGEPAKYVNSPETALFRKSNVLYGLHAAKETMRKADCILLVEGQFDLILAHQAGLRFAVAVSGTALTPEHLTLLARYSKRLVLGLDNDAAGLRSGIKSAGMALAAGFDVKIPKLPDDCKDPADTAAKDPELLKAAVRESRTAIEFFLDALKPETRDERAYKKAVEAAILPLIAVLPSRIEAAHFVTIVANRLRVPEDSVRTEVEKARRRTGSSYQTGTTVEPAQPALRKEETKLSRLEKAAAMIAVQPRAPAAVRSRLIEVLGAERVKEVEEKAAPYAEEIRFRFESMLGEPAAETGQTETDAYASLLATVEGEKLDEEIDAATKKSMPLAASSMRRR